MADPVPHGDDNVPEETQNDWQESAQQALENPKPQPTIKVLLEIGCGKEITNTGTVTVFCQLTRLCSSCEAKLLDITKSQLVGHIQSLQDQVIRQRDIITRRTDNPRPRYLKPYQSPRRSS